MLAAMAAAQAGRLPEAGRYARRAVERQDAPATRMTLGRVLLETGDYQESLESLRIAAADPAIRTDAYFHSGQALTRLGRLTEAAEVLELAVASRPDHAPAWEQIGVIRFRSGDTAGARRAFERSLDTRPEDPGTLARLALACYRQGDIDAATRALDAACRRAPESLPVLVARATVLRGTGRLAEALETWERCVELDADSVPAWTGLASAKQASGDLAGAEQAFRRALELDPADPDAVAGLAELCEWQGRYQQGLEVLTGAPTSAVGPGTELVAGRLLRRQGDLLPARRRLEGSIPDADRDQPLRRQFAFSLGDVCDALGDTEAAWQWYSEGNRLTRTGFHPEAHRKWLDRMRTAVADAGVDPSRGQGLVFIVGMPRSGTTLVEQILAAHPQVSAGGELQHLGRLVHGLDQGRALPLPAESIRALGERYLESVADLLGGAKILTDKMPLNYQYLGIIRAALPGARIIHCRRDPRDVAVSCFFTDFIDPALGFATRLDWLADYLLAYEEFMDGWSGVFGQRMRELRYESLVAEPEGEVRELLAFLDLPWEPGCLRFHEQDRFAATASHAQVRQPVYRSAVGRWRAYAHHLEPLLKRMGAGD